MVGCHGLCFVTVAPRTSGRGTFLVSAVRVVKAPLTLPPGLPSTLVPVA